MTKIAAVVAGVVLVAIIRVLIATHVRTVRKSMSERSSDSLINDQRVERLSVAEQPQQLWWIMSVEGGILIQQLMCSARVPLHRMVAGSIQHFSRQMLPQEPLDGILVCCGLAMPHPMVVFGTVGIEDGWEYYNCPLCEVSYRKEHENAV